MADYSTHILMLLIIAIVVHLADLGDEFKHGQAFTWCGTIVCILSAICLFMLAITGV